MSIVVSMIHLVVVRVLVAVSGMAVRMATVARERPGQKPDSGKYEDDADDVALLRLEGMTELEAHGSNDARDDQRGEYVSDRGKEADPGNVRDAPPLRPPDNCQRHPVIRQDGVEEADGAGGDDQERDRRAQERLKGSLAVPSLRYLPSIVPSC